jgi:hypothetical protein
MLSVIKYTKYFHENGGDGATVTFTALKYCNYYYTYFYFYLLNMWVAKGG